MDSWTHLMLSQQNSRELRQAAARHQLAKLAAMSARTRRPSQPPVRQDQDSGRTGTVTNLRSDSHRRLSTQRQEAS
jgi:hypothetical protein